MITFGWNGRSHSPECVNRPFKLLKQSEGFRVGKRQELHQNDTSYASIEIDPEMRIPVIVIGHSGRR